MHRRAVPRPRLDDDRRAEATGDLGGAVAGAVVHDDHPVAGRHPRQQAAQRRPPRRGTEARGRRRVRPCLDRREPGRLRAGRRGLRSADVAAQVTAAPADAPRLRSTGCRRPRRAACGRARAGPAAGDARRWPCPRSPAGTCTCGRVPAAARRLAPARRLGHAAGRRAGGCSRWWSAAAWRTGCPGGGCCWRRTPPGWRGCWRSRCRRADGIGGCWPPVRVPAHARGRLPTPATAGRSTSSRIPIDAAPDNWPVHIAGHPPGALLFFVLLDRIGLGRRAGGRARGDAARGDRRRWRCWSRCACWAPSRAPGGRRRSWSSGRPRCGSASRRTRCSRRSPPGGIAALALAPRSAVRDSSGRCSRGCCSAGA